MADFSLPVSNAVKAVGVTLPGGFWGEAVGGGRPENDRAAMHFVASFYVHPC